MNNTPTYWNTAKKYLSKKDKVMSSLINKYKSPSETILTSRKDVFFLFAKVLLVNKLVLLQQILFFYDLKKNVKIKLTQKRLMPYHLFN